MDDTEMRIKTVSRLLRTPPDEQDYSPVDLVDQIQREALRDRFRRADAHDYPSLRSVRRGIAELSRSHWVPLG